MTRIAYLIPEFPGQTHTWIWRELVWLRRWGADVRLVSTRPPPARDRARHAFASAAAETFYLFEGDARSTGDLLIAGARTMFSQPFALERAFELAMRLPIDGGHNATRCLPLLAPAARLADWCRREQIDHVHCHTCGKGAIIAMMNRELSGVPYSLTINANLEWWGGAMAEKIGGAGFAVSTMRWVQKQAEESFPPEVAERVGYAPVGVDTDDWAPIARAEPEPGAPLRLVCVGRLHESKGFPVALRALAQLRDAGIAARLTILGDGPERQNLTDLVAELKIADLVTMPGSVAEDQVRRTVGQADIFLLPSRAEPLGVVVMEAMAMETPVVVTAAGGVTEIVTDGEDGMMVPPGDPDALARAVRTLAESSDRRRELGRAGRESVVRKFDARIGARIMYEKLFDRAPPG